MTISLGEKLKELRKAKNVSQEQFASYLGVSFQAVSKWENSITSPDITLLPSIARYYGITVDNLLQVEHINADEYFENCSKQAANHFRNNHLQDVLSVWLEAYQKLPNDIRVKEMLMSIYYDIDKVKYQNQIIELGTEIYHDFTAESFYKGQAIKQIAVTYAHCGNQKKAIEWVKKAHQINHAQEMLYMQVLSDDQDLVDTFNFANHWYFDMLFYMVARLNQCNIKLGSNYVQKVTKATADVLELVYPNDDMGFETLRHLCILHRCVAEDETKLGGNEAVVKYHLTRAVSCAVQSAKVTAHALPHPLVCGWAVENTPEDRTQIVRSLLAEMKWTCFENYQTQNWFADLITTLEEAV